MGAISEYGEVYETQVLIKGMQDCSVVFHLAAIVDTKTSYDKMFHVNVGGTEAVAQAALECGVSKLIDLSTVCVVLDGKPKFDIDLLTIEMVNDMLIPKNRSSLTA